VVEKAMASEPGDRYSTAAELRDDLLRFLAHEAIVGRREGPFRRARKWLIRRRRTVATLAALAIVALFASLWTRQVSRARERGEIARAAAIALDGAPLVQRPVTELLGIAEFTRSYNRRRLGTPPRELLRLEALMQDFRDEQVRQVTAEIEMWRAPDLLDADREFRRLRLLQRLIDLRSVFPDDREVRNAAAPESVYPRLTVNATDSRGAPIAAVAWLSAVNVPRMQVGAARSLSAVPIKGAVVEPGYYRLRIEFASGGDRELPVYFGLNSTSVSVVATQRDDEHELSKTMVTIPARDFAMPEDYVNFPFGHQTVHTPAFLIDPTEVSNRQYAEFLRATHRDPPHYWPAPYDPSIDDLPVVGVCWEDAAAYAAWAGKRLPTLPEWLAATGVVLGRPFPWVDAEAGSGSSRGNVRGTPRSGPPSREAEWKCYLENAVAVGSCPEASTPEGVFHLYGNVSEWTESMAVNYVEMGGLWTTGNASEPPLRAMAASPWERICAGAAWNAIASHQQVVFIREFGISRSHVAYHIGFRCAKSLPTTQGEN
jgi:formylglycine-generating enzyme required for sulfatase activity